MKRLLAIILCISAVLCLASCSKTGGGEKVTAEAVTGETSENTAAGESTKATGTTSATLPPETADVNNPETLEDIEEGEIIVPGKENIKYEELPEFIGGGVEFDTAKQYDTIPEALAAAGIDLPGLADKFAEFGIRDITVMEDGTVSVRVNYSNSYYDYRINASKDAYIGDVDAGYIRYSDSKSSDSNAAVTMYGEAADSYYLAVWKYGKYSYSIVSGEPLPWEEFNWVISD